VRAEQQLEDRVQLLLRHITTKFTESAVTDSLVWQEVELATALQMPAASGAVPSMGSCDSSSSASCRDEKPLAVSSLVGQQLPPGIVAFVAFTSTLYPAANSTLLNPADVRLTLHLPQEMNPLLFANLQRLGFDCYPGMASVVLAGSFKPAQQQPFQGLVTSKNPGDTITCMGTHQVRQNLRRQSVGTQL
jgi:hypothetical protein